MSLPNVSRETPETAFLRPWRRAVELAGPSLFGGQAARPATATHWRQLTPKLDLMRKAVPNRSQADAAFIGALASFYNAEEGQKLLNKAGCGAFGNLPTVLDAPRRALLADLLAGYQGW